LRGVRHDDGTEGSTFLFGNITCAVAANGIITAVARVIRERMIRMVSESFDEWVLVDRIHFQVITDFNNQSEIPGILKYYSLAVSSVLLPKAESFSRKKS
jgi:hypothetical protein